MQIQTAHYDLVTSWQGGMASRTLCQSFSEDNALPALQSHVIDSDEPVSLGGEGLAPDPQELILAAFNACMMAAFIQEARNEGLALTHLEIHTDGHLPKGIPASGDKRADDASGTLQYVIHVSGDGTVHQFNGVHQRVINASLNRWLLAQNMLIEGDLILC
ncbi:TPA: OsmC family protein [Enterobacter kobei]|uniref:OsmC family protein n=1 Tax=Enterobacter TaxID=547 RepID=UPI0013A72A1A|nr:MULTISPECIES: OsmC family protein [Enterobacter]ELE9244882.1 OsmC family protein [Enterobacter kobei]ELJ5852112.1 OsmC family protein [Enterobacter kobei]ELJ5856586.1 OsmC family protein [Enterobacter kobei]MBE8918471.1 OsmC family protein [Enterobacter kobei]MCE1978318.1 OsmC family protein [Enterobacter kobei]